jgi:putative ubiquitin-RnfH superfamily antitoxin RatB of RatAB toxin-antitoxin module
MSLSGEQREQLRDALLSAFPDKSSLEQLLFYKFSKNLDEIVIGRNLQDIILNLIKEAEADGWIEKLVRAACDTHPKNPNLKKVREELLQALGNENLQHLPQRNEYDIFLSYASRDNTILLSEQKQWVNSFHDSLKNLLGTHIGRVIEIYPDDKDVITGDILHALENSKTLITVISPNYIKLQLFRNKINIFHEGIRKISGSPKYQKDNSQESIFRIDYYPIHYSEENTLPNPIKGLSNKYIFHKPGIQDGQIQTLRPEIYKEDASKYSDQLHLLTYNLKRTLNEIEGIQISFHKKIYLAETIDFLRSERESLEKELLDADYVIFPDRRKALLNSQEEISESIEGCQLSIYIIGKDPTTDPSVNNSVFDRIFTQLDIVKQKNLMCIVWKPSRVHISETIEKKLLQYLNNPADFLKNSLEKDVKLYIQDKLQRIHQASVDSSPTFIDNLLVSNQDFSERSSINNIIKQKIYLIYDKNDSIEEILKIENSLQQEEKISIFRPLFEGSPKEIRQHHEQNLRECDRVIIIYSQRVNQKWLEAQQREILKIKPKRMEDKKNELIVEEQIL